MADEQRRAGIGGIGEGIRAGIGILSAFKEAVEETFPASDPIAPKRITR